MKSAPRGKSTLVAEVTNISKNGFWLLLGQDELFVSFGHFPWFANASINQILNVEWPSSHHLYWPELDVDLSVDSIRKPEDFPLVSKPGSNNAQQRSGLQVTPTAKQRVRQPTRR